MNLSKIKISQSIKTDNLKEILLLSTLLLISTFTFTQELILNGGFETGAYDNWDTSSSSVQSGFPTSGAYNGNIANGAGYIKQTIIVEPGTLYKVSFNYRTWNGTATTPIKATIKNSSNDAIIASSNNFDLTAITYTTENFYFTPAAGVTSVYFEIEKGTDGGGNNAIKLDEVSVFGQSYSTTQERIVDGGFETNNFNYWATDNCDIETEPASGAYNANLKNGAAYIKQPMVVESGTLYNVSFKYKTFNGTATAAIKATIKNSSNDAEIASSNNFDLTTLTYRTENFSFTPAAGVTNIYFEVQKDTDSGNNNIMLDDISIVSNSSLFNFIDPLTPDNAQPAGVPGSWNLDFSDEFNGTQVDTSKWLVSVSTKSRASRTNLGVTDWRWTANHVSLNGTDLVLSGEKTGASTMQCGSVESRGIYETTYGYLEARIKIADTSKGNHTAFWIQGSNQRNVDDSAADGAEVDIFESAWTTDTSKTVVHYDGYISGTKHNHTIPYNTPGIHNGYHVFGLLWTDSSMEIYYDGVKVESTSNKTFPIAQSSAGHPLVPQVPEWLWLSVGATFGLEGNNGGTGIDFQSQPIGPLSDALVDYVRVYKPRVEVEWTGTASSDWDTAVNWNIGLPTANNDVTIPTGTSNNPIISAATGAVAKDIVTNDVLTINSGGSLIVDGTSTGNITYNVAVADTDWHLISSPVAGQGYNDAWANNNAIANGSGTNRGISTYQNGTPDLATGPWVYMLDGESETFGSGTGYSLKRTTSGNYAFTGAYPAGTITPTLSTDVNDWNLIGNPYPAYIDIAAFITENDDYLSDAYSSVYVWNVGANSYNALTTGSIHPGQAFFVNSKVNGTASITEALQSHKTGVTFYKNAITSISLVLTSDKSTKTTKINYLEGKTAGLDKGFDIGMFNGVASDISVYTHLLENNQGIAFARQALPSKDLELMTIPVGVKAAANKEITFSAEALNIPAGIKVFLEDRVNNTVTRLDEANSNYKVTLTEALNGVGRFYMRTESSALSIDNIALNGVSIFKSNNSTLKIAGLQQGKAAISLFNIQGKKIFSTSFEANGVQEITLPKLATGIYVIQLTTEAGKLDKKIILE